MKCLRCGYCCMNLAVIIVNDPDKGIKENNLKVHEGKGKCPHLQGDKVGEYSCALHNRPWYHKTPCAAHGQIESKATNKCRMGEFMMKRSK